MLKLRTKIDFTIPTERGVTQGIVRLIIEKREEDINNIIARGYYYYLDENQTIIKLSDISTLIPWDTIEVIENNILNPLVSTVNLRACVLQRIEEFTMIKLTEESGENYGTTPDDWEKDV